MGDPTSARAGRVVRLRLAGDRRVRLDGRGSRAAAAGSTSELVCYVAPSGFDSPLGTTCVETHRVGGVEASDWWIPPALGIAVRGQIAGGMEYVLSSLTVAPPAS